MESGINTWALVELMGHQRIIGKVLGNSMAVPCMAWLGRRIMLVEAIK